MRLIQAHQRKIFRSFPPVPTLGAPIPQLILSVSILIVL